MKNKVMTILALMLFMSAFLLSMTVYASGTTDNMAPSLTAKLSGGTLHIEAKDGSSGVEAVFINGHKTSYPVGSALDVPLSKYAGTGQFVSVYAVDVAGNRSETVQVENPYYKALSTAKNASAAPTPKSSESAVPAQTRPFTPEGTGTTVDNAKEDDGKEFFTITTPDKHVFYLIIDRQRESENVYFLNAVTEDDLRSLAKKGSSNSEVSTIPIPQSTSNPETTSKTEQKPQPEKGNNSTLIFVLLAVAAAGGAGYYFKIYKPKHQALDTDEDDWDGDENDYEEENVSLPDEKENKDDFLSSEDDSGELFEDDLNEENKE